jgi:hypothetical protein
MMEKIHNLKLFGLVACLAFALVFIGVDFIEGQVKTLGKPDKPDKPGKTETEWIAFDGDLEGGQPVDGCCPNAGPFPEYIMTLAKDVGSVPAGTYNGYLFINNYGAGRDHKYKVQFWNDDLYIFIQIIGGEIVVDRKNKLTTVTFIDEECVDMWTGTTTKVTFTIVRHPY